MSTVAAEIPHPQPAEFAPGDEVVLDPSLGLPPGTRGTVTSVVPGSRWPYVVQIASTGTAYSVTPTLIVHAPPQGPARLT